MTNSMNAAAKPTPADDFRKMMLAWTTIEAAARDRFPEASEEEIYQICAGAMRHQLGM